MGRLNHQIHKNSGGNIMRIVRNQQDQKIRREKIKNPFKNWHLTSVVSQNIVLNHQLAW